MMPAPVVLVGGTWSQQQAVPWWRHDSPFAAYLQGQGVHLYRPDGYQFEWSGNLDGIDRTNNDWRIAGRTLVAFTRGSLISAVSHSHGAQVLAYAAEAGQKFSSVITLGAPVRGDLQDQYYALLAGCFRWTHIYTDERVGVGYQVLGAFGWGRLFDAPMRKMLYAHENLFELGLSHSALMDVALWSKRGWHDLLFPDRWPKKITGTD